MFPKSALDSSYSSDFNNHAHLPDEVETVVGPSVVVEGDFASEGNILVKGTVSGSVKTARLLTVESGAKILANVKAGDAVVAGEVRGNIKVENQLELTSSARVLGDIVCQVLVVAAGALMQGKIAMKGLEESDPSGAGAAFQPERKRGLRPKFKTDEEPVAEDMA